MVSERLYSNLELWLLIFSLDGATPKTVERTESGGIVEALAGMSSVSKACLIVQNAVRNALSTLKGSEGSFTKEESTGDGRKSIETTSVDVEVNLFLNSCCF